MSSLHAIKRERGNARLVQAKRVMPLIASLLDAWEGMPNDLKGDIKDQSPDVYEAMTKIDAAIEDGLEAHE